MITIDSNEETKQLEQMIDGHAVIPVIEISDANDTVPLCHALQRGGINIAEITLRTDKALNAIEKACSVDGMLVAAGTVKTGAEAVQAVNAGAHFGVSPGAYAELIDKVKALHWPFMPGAATPSEVMHLRVQGFLLQKIFPAELIGGITMVRMLASVFAAVKFCPTGGIGVDKVANYLALANITCLGGSWIAPRALIERRDWHTIESNAHQAAKIANEVLQRKAIST